MPKYLSIYYNRQILKRWPRRRSVATEGSGTKAAQCLDFHVFKHAENIRRAPQKCTEGLRNLDISTFSEDFLIGYTRKSVPLVGLKPSELVGIKNRKGAMINLEKVKVIDAVMGAGKTTWALNKIEHAPADEKFIYITPFLSEVERVIKTVKSRSFVQPTNAAAGGRKLNSLKKQLENGDNIAATHALFEMADDELIDLLKTSNYTLVLDEVMDVIEKASVSPSDMRLLLDKHYIEIIDNRVVWTAPEIEYEYGRFDDIKLLAKAGNLFYHRDRFLIWAFPPQVFAAFDQVYVMTYLFNAQIQRYYFDLYGIDYELFSLKDGAMAAYDKTADKRGDLIKLIDLYEGDHNKHGEGRTAFSTGWLERKDGDELINIRRSIESYVRRVAKAKTKDVLWTTKQSVKPFLQGKGYTRGFIPMTLRATNDYADRSVLVYAYNRFMNPFEKSFFQDNGVTVDEDLLAVSDLLQWIWRSRIRNGKPIKLYLPAARMRSLLKAWANYEI